MTNYQERIALLFSLTIMHVLQISGNTYWNDFTNINIGNELSHYTINNILQDSEGYIWIASNNGLIRYDKDKYKTYKDDPNTPDGIKGLQIHKLFEDANNKLWIATNMALNLYDNLTDQITPIFFYNKNFSEPIPIVDIDEYNDSTFIVATDGAGLFLFNPKNKSYEQVKLVNKRIKPDGYLHITDLLIDKNRNIWVASSSQGLLKFDIHTKKTSLTNTDVLQLSEISTLDSYTANKILIGTYDNGIWEYDTKSDTIIKCKWQQKSFEKALKQIYSIKYSSKENAIYIGTARGGLIKYNVSEDQLTPYQHRKLTPYSIANNAVKSILIDSEDNLWLGHYKGGVSFALNHPQFNNVNNHAAPAYSLSNNLVSCIINDNNGNVLIGTDGGGLNIMKQDGSIVNSSNSEAPLLKKFKDKSVLALLKDKQNNIWVGTHLDGVYIIPAKSKEIRHFNKKHHRLSSNSIRCFYEDSMGKIWIGTNGGGINIYYPSKDSIAYITRNDNSPSNSISTNKITCIHEDSYGYFWIGTANGLNKYNPENKSYTKYFYNIDNNNSLSNNYIHSVFEDSNHKIWVGTSCGLNRYSQSDNKFIKYYTENGLPDNIIYNITEDKQKNLWISTHKGISCFSIRNSTFYNYYKNNGLLSNSFIDGAMYQSAENVIYLGSIQGLTYFFPSEMEQPSPKGTLVFTDFKIFNNSVPVGAKIDKRIILKKHISKTDSITLSSKENIIEFEFALHNCNYIEETKYEYMLENFEKEWTSIDYKQRKATYSNLKPGEYVFKVRTKFPISQEKSIVLTITPSFIQSAWFKFFVGLFLFVALYYWKRTHALNVKNQEVVSHKNKVINDLESTKEEITQTNKSLQRKLDGINAQLTSSTLLISHKNEVMKDIKNKLTDFTANNKSIKLNNELEEIISSINKEFKIEEDWRKFEEHFNHMHNGFFKKLKKEYCDLSSSHLKLSAYLKMNLTSKEIASLMNISVRGVEKARYRLKQKLDIPKGEKLTTFINNL